jgi:osmoprotectant transport system permease protein
LNLDYLFEHWPRVLHLAAQHLLLSGAAIALALPLALLLGLLAARFHRLTLPIIGFLGALYTVPSIAFLAILIPVLGIGRRNALVVLAAYAQIFLVRNIVAGLRGVDPAALEAAQGMGMTSWQVFRRVRWPLALPVMIAGVRTAAVATIGLAAIAAWIAAGGLGELLFEGLARLYWSEVLAGTIAIVALTLVVDGALRLAESATAASRARRAAR